MLFQLKELRMRELEEKRKLRQLEMEYLKLKRELGE